jgi:neutral ceramidase
MLANMVLSSLMIFLIVLVLIEFTTMAGRRLRDAVKMVLTSGGHGDFNNNVHVVIAGLTNTYSQYVTTFEEYEAQRYEVSSWFHGSYGTNAFGFYI